jgi:dihydrofolate reductase
MKFFKETTIGNVCVMGHNTWLTLKKPLVNRLNIVLSRRAEIEPRDSVITLRDIGSVLSLSPYLKTDLFVIGGAKVYSSFLPYIERWFVTEVPLTVEGADTFMPRDFLEGFQLVDSKELEDGLIVKTYERSI